jgi:Skp family chaperone for outer membrane proteins
MKHCPECSADYADNVSFCAKDGRSLATVSTAATRLCPHCANGIAEDATQCPYCKADVEPAAPEWLIRDEGPSEPRSRVRQKTAAPKVMVIAAIVLCVLVAALYGMGSLGNSGSSATRDLLEQKTRELQAREEQIKALETELKKVRLENADITKEAVALKARLEERQKELAASEQRLAAKREMERAATRQPQVERRSNPRPVERAAAPATPAPRPAQSGVYETLRATEVHERPAQSSRVISRIGSRTRINVVGGDGEWLEIVSKRGNPPGFVLRADARAVSASNN